MEETEKGRMSKRDSNISSNVILDPSLLLVERSLSKVAYTLAELSDDFSFHISRHFYDILQERKSESLTIDYFRYTSRLVDIDRVKLFLDENSKYIQKFEMPEWASREYRRSYEAIFQSLPAKYRYEENLHNIIFEEWFFLKEHSWIVARTKRIYNLFIRSGEAGLEFGSRVFDRAVRRTLRMPLSEIVQKAHRLSAIGKWSAVGGPALANLLGPNLQVIADLSAGFLYFFILFDP